MPRIVTTEELVDYWPAVVTAEKFATLQEALSQCLQPGRCALVVRISTADLGHRAPEVLQRNLHICVNLSYAQARDILTGTAMHETTAFLQGHVLAKASRVSLPIMTLAPSSSKLLMIPDMAHNPLSTKPRHLDWHCLRADSSEVLENGKMSLNPKH